MTKEELEKEAEEKYSEVDREFIACQDEGEVFTIGYILGAEPREKQIADLEEEIAGLREQLQIATDYPEWSKVVKLSQEDCIREVAELRKENAELKDDNMVMANNYSKMEQKFYDNLTKATKLIKDLLGSENTSCEEEMFFEIRHKAEQFLKDSEVEK